MIGSSELIAILIAALFLFGPKKLPELARSLGGAVGEFKKAQRAAELELTEFDAYTRKTGKGTREKEEEKEKKESESDDKETKANKGLENVLEARQSVPAQDKNPEQLKSQEKPN